MGRFGFSVADVGRGGRESTVDVSPGTRRTTSFWMVCGFWRGICYDVKDEIANILVAK